MSEIYPSQPAEQGDDLPIVFDKSVQRFSDFALHYCDVQTVADYYASRKQLRQKADELFDEFLEDQIISEPVVIYPKGNVARIVDAVSGNEALHQGAVFGHLHSFVIEKDVDDVDAIYEAETLADLQTGSVRGIADLMKNPDNPIRLSLGLKIKPFFNEDGFNAEKSFIRLPVSRIERIERQTDDLHPFIDEDNFMNNCYQELLYRSGDRVKGAEIVAFLEDMVTKRSANTRLKDKTFDLIFYDQTSCKVLGNVTYDEDDQFSEFNSDSIVRAKFHRFGWELHREADKHVLPEAYFYAYMEFVDDDDIEKYGGEVFSVAIDDMRFGRFVDDESVMTEPQDIFLRERLWFEQVLADMTEAQLTTPQINAGMKDFAEVISRYGRLIGAKCLLQLDKDLVDNVEQITSGQSEASESVEIRITKDHQYSCEIVGFEVGLVHEDDHSAPYYGLYVEVDTSEDVACINRQITSIMIQTGRIVSGQIVSSPHWN